VVDDGEHRGLEDAVLREVGEPARQRLLRYHTAEDFGGLKIKISGFGFWFSGFGFRVSDFRLRKYFGQRRRPAPGIPRADGDRLGRSFLHCRCGPLGIQLRDAREARPPRKRLCACILPHQMFGVRLHSLRMFGVRSHSLRMFWVRLHSLRFTLRFGIRVAPAPRTHATPESARWKRLECLGSDDTIYGLQL